MYSDGRVYGPYLRKDGRKHVIILYPSGKRRTVSYPKFLMECYLGRYLEKNETVDHIDGDFTNDKLSNLQVLDHQKHVKLDVRRRRAKAFVCPQCSTKFILEGIRLNDATMNRKKGRFGPFCGRSCAGTYSQRIQMGEPAGRVTEIDSEYYTLKSYLNPGGGDPTSS